MALKLVAFYGSVRTSRQGIKAARFIVKECEKRGHEVFLVDPLEHQLPMLDKMYKQHEPGKAPEPLQTIANHVIAADGYLVVTGEYNHNVPPALANVMDHFLDEYFYKPSGIVCYSAGGFGGVRAMMACRPMLAEMGMSSIPSVLPIPKVQAAFNDDGTPTDDAWYRRADRFLTEFEWYAEALRAARIKDGKQACPERAECAQSTASGS